MVVCKRAVIEDQSHVRVVVAKDIIVKRLTFRKVLRQKQCLPACRHQRIFFEGASCKNSETSCLESRRNFWFDGVPVKFIRNRCRCISALFKFSCTAASQYTVLPRQTTYSRQKKWKISNPHSTQNFFFFVFLCTHFQGSWMAQQKVRKTVVGYGSVRHCPCSRQQPAVSSAWVL